jgi:hypothetical protein
VTSVPADPSPRRRDAAIVAGIAVLFVALRAAIIWARDPFFDELFSAWMARRPLHAILPALRQDSGPPLYYVLARLDGVYALRLLSLAISAVPAVLLLRERRWVPALLLAVHPAAALFSATARPYALCAAFVALGVLYLERDRVWPAAAAFTGAAYSHYYGALFLPTLLFCRAPLKQRILAGAAAGITFIPGLLLSFAQPKAATAWMTAPDLQQVLSAFVFLSDDPGVAPWVTALAFLLTAVAVSRSSRFAGVVLVPVLLAVALSFALRPAYFPVRFASVIAFPLILWIDASLANWKGMARRLLVLALTFTGIAAIGAGVIVHLERPLSAYREAALVLRRNAAPTETIVATGYMYLEAVHQLPDHPIQACPREQAQHPGWRTPPGSTRLHPAMLPRTTFLWTGERQAPELRVILASRRTEVLFENGRAVILRVY